MRMRHILYWIVCCLFATFVVFQMLDFKQDIIKLNNELRAHVIVEDNGR